MGRCKWLILLWMACLCWSCKKQIVEPEITVKNTYVQLVTSNQVDVNYELSNLGYQETGVSYYKQSDPAKVTTVKAIRQGNILSLSMQNLDTNTDYIFKIFFTQGGLQKTDVKEYTVKTLSSESLKFTMHINSTLINYDKDGNFTAEIEGENLNNLNLSQLEIKIDSSPLSFGYPILLSGSKYKIIVKGTVRPENVNYTFIASYQGKDIFFQSVPFAFDGERYWLSAKSTTLRGYYASIFNNELYYFFDEKVSKWNEAEQRLVQVGTIQSGTIIANTVGLQYDGQLFFAIGEKNYLPNPKDLSDTYCYPEVYSHAPGTDKWITYPFMNQLYKWQSRVLGNQNYFIHKGELYLSYSLTDNPLFFPGMEQKIDRYIYHYNKLKKQFETVKNLNTDIINYQFVSINDQMYVVGLVPVEDQGFKMSATLAVLKVSDNFTLEEIYRGGTVKEALSLIPKSVIAYDQKILIALSLNDFLIFEPSNKQLSPVYFRQSIPNMYFGGLFTFNNKLHLNADLMFTSQKVYEISITKSR